MMCKVFTCLVPTIQNLALKRIQKSDLVSCGSGRRLLFKTKLLCFCSVLALTFLKLNVKLKKNIYQSYH